jgi:hypothetical protein
MVLQTNGDRLQSNVYGVTEELRLRFDIVMMVLQIDRVKVMLLLVLLSDGYLVSRLL